MTVTVTLRERGSNAFLELRSLFIKRNPKGLKSYLASPHRVRARAYEVFSACVQRPLACVQRPDGEVGTPDSDPRLGVRLTKSR